jgi:CubicO group peptidase (beta-lactamase class C family)
MKNTQLLDRRRVIPNRAYGYREEREEVRTVDCRWLTYGDGGLLSSLRDLQVWVRGLSAGELVCEEVLELAFTSGRTSDGTATGYGFGWQLRELQGGAGQAVYHAGGDPGFGSLIWRFPAEDLCILALSNLDESWRQMMEIVRGVEAKMS